MNDLNDWLEKLSRGVDHMGKEYERFAGRLGERFGEGFDSREGDDGSAGESLDLPFGTKPELHLHAGVANVVLRQVKSGEAPRLMLREPNVYQATIDADPATGAIDVELKPRLGFDLLQRSPSVTVFIPEGTRVRGRVDAGRISAEGLQGTELDLRTNAGALRVRGCAGHARLAAGAGKIDVDGYSGSLDARTDAGAIRCQELRLDAGTHVVGTSVGAIDVALVPDVKVRLETHTTLGSISNNLGEGDAGAQAILRLSTELGSLRVRRSEPAPSPLRSVPVSDERAMPDGKRGEVGTTEDRSTDAIAASKSPPAADGVDQHAARGATHNGTAESGGSETLRILDMLERHEISAAEAADLLAALRR